jgi:hypothetical protein
MNRRAISHGCLAIVLLSTLWLAAPETAGAKRLSSKIGAFRVLTPSPIEKYGRFEFAFDLTGATATNPYWPYDPAPPPGIPAGTGISVNVQFLPPGVTRWEKGLTLPCFYYQPVEERGAGTQASLVPVGAAEWRCRFTPDMAGAWKYRVTVEDAKGVTRSLSGSFEVIPSTRRGFVGVSASDPTRFEFSDGAPFTAPLLNAETGNPFNGLSNMRANLQKLAANGARWTRWLPTGEGANYDIIPYGDDIKSSWAFGSAGTDTIDADVATGKLFSFSPYYYSSQRVPAVPNARYRLTFAAYLTGDKIFEPAIQAGGVTLGKLKLCGNPATCPDTRPGWNGYALEVANNTGGATVTVLLRAGLSEGDVTPGAIRLHSISLQRDETGSGAWGPNLLARGDPDTYAYVDQVGAARLDELLRISEGLGIYHTLPLFHKQDAILSRIQSDGATTPAKDVNRFYAGEGQAVRWLERAYARYFVARWSYSTALFAVELANENMLSAESYDAAFAIAQTVKDLSPRHILQSNSFWGWFVDPFWTDPARGSLMDYADKHWYAATQPDGSGGELISMIWDDSAANARECWNRFTQYEAHFALRKPIVRGETGVAVSGTYPQHPDVVRDPSGTYYKKQLWAQVGAAGHACVGEWYTNTVDRLGLWPMYAAYERFMQGEPLTSGGWAPIGTDRAGPEAVLGTVTAGEIRAWGQRQTATGRTLLWIDNTAHTWRNVVNGIAIIPAAATLTVQGLPQGRYTVEWWDTVNGFVSGIEEHDVTSDGQLQLAVTDLATDVAVKLTWVAAPQATTTHIGDLDATSSSANPSRWRARVTIRAHDGVHNLLADATITGYWGEGSGQTVSCVTRTDGECSVSTNLLPGATPSVAFTVTGIVHSGLTYDAAANHDPDGDSTGAVIIITRPPGMLSDPSGN